ncbi:hypothetical protein HMPREF9401_0832 [Aliarcobacter butzleri JV22]|nr:hypothetical protein HMPREF9401_0832 [Aliarcobacter butzleri JV22]
MASIGSSSTINMSKCFFENKLFDNLCFLLDIIIIITILSLNGLILCESLIKCLLFVNFYSNDYQNIIFLSFLNIIILGFIIDLMIRVRAILKILYKVKNIKKGIE